MIRRLALNNIVLVFQYAVGALVPLLLIPHIVRELGLAQFGALAIALACANYGALIVQYGFHLSGPYELTNVRPGETATDVICRIAAAKGVLFGLVMLVLAIATGVTAAMGESFTAAQVWLLSAIPFAAALHTGWHLQVLGRFGSVAILSISGAGLSLVLGLNGVSAEAESNQFLAALALSLGPVWVGAGTLLTSALLLPRGDNTIKSRLGSLKPWSVLGEGWPLFASQFVSALYTASGAIVVGVLAGVEQAGAYGAIERVSSGLVGVCLLIHAAAYPTLVQLYESSRTSYIRLMRFVLLGYLVLAATAAFVAALAWVPLLQFVLGPQGTQYAPLLSVALVWILLGIFGTALTGYLAARGDGQLVLPLNLKVLAVSFLLGVPGTVVWGAWAWMAALCVAQIVVLAAGWRAWSIETKTLGAQRQTSNALL
jgi:PST family polysaccharide transporter